MVISRSIHVAANGILSFYCIYLPRILHPFISDNAFQGALSYFPQTSSKCGLKWGNMLPQPPKCHCFLSPLFHSFHSIISGVPVVSHVGSWKLPLAFSPAHLWSPPRSPRRTCSVQPLKALRQGPGMWQMLKEPSECSSCLTISARGLLEHVVFPRGSPSPLSPFSRMKIKTETK